MNSRLSKKLAEATVDMGVDGKVGANADQVARISDDEAMIPLNRTLAALRDQLTKDGFTVKWDEGDGVGLWNVTIQKEPKSEETATGNVAGVPKPLGVSKRGGLPDTSKLANDEFDKKKPSSKKKIGESTVMGRLAAGLQSIADELAEAKGEKIDLSKLKAGTRVKHPWHGKGTIEVDKKDGPYIHWDNDDYSYPAPTSAMMRDLELVEAVKLPSEDGKPSYDDDFKAGFAAGQAAVKANPKADGTDAKAAYKKVSSKHGSWWLDGFNAAIDAARGAYAAKHVLVAKKLGLVESAPPGLLQECSMLSPIYGDHQNQTVEEKLRSAIMIIKYAIQDEVMKDLGDDGRRMKFSDNPDGGFYAQFDRLIADNITVAGLKQLIPLGKNLLAKFLE